MKNPFNFAGCQFASFIYTNQFGIVSTYTVLLGVTYEISQQKDLISLIEANFANKDLEIAKTTLATALVSNMIGKDSHKEFFEDNFEKIGTINDPKIAVMLDTFAKEGDTKQYQSNQSKGQDEGFTHLDIKGMKVCKETENLHIQAQFVKKTQSDKQIKETELNIASGNFKEIKPKKSVNSKQATLDKNEVKKSLDLRGSKIVSFIFEEGRTKKARVNKTTIVFD